MRQKFVLHRLCLLAVSAAVVAATPALAQMPWGDPAPDKGVSKDNAMLRRALAAVADDAADSTLQLNVLDEDGNLQPAALAVVVSVDGIVLTKASEIDETVSALVPVPGNVPVRAAGRIVERDPVHDLATVKLDLPSSLKLDVLTFMGGSTPAAGAWLLSADADADGPGGEVASPVAVGNVSMTGTRAVAETGLKLGIEMQASGAGGIPIVRVPRGGAAAAAGIEVGDLIVARDGVPVGTRQDFTNRLRFDRPSELFVLTVNRQGQIVELPVRLRDGQLGISVGEAVAGVVVRATQPGSPADEAGIRPMDLITQVEGENIFNGESLIQRLASYRAGDRVELKLLREGRPIVTSTQLGDSGRSFRARLQNALGGSTRNRRSGDFPEVIQHDTVLAANQMGGPVVDLEGRVVGINIARAGRVETYAIPASVLAEIVPTLLDGIPNE